MAIVYQHIRKDTNEVFYIGIGKEEKRAYQKKNRNKYWKNIVNKVGYYVEIIYPDLEWKLACNMEQYLIEAYGRIDLGNGCLVNMTNGGEGATGRFGILHPLFGKESTMKGKNHTDEARKKISESAKGNKNMLGKKHSNEARKKMSETAKENYKNGLKPPRQGIKIGKSPANAKMVINLENGFIFDSVWIAWESQQREKSYKNFARKLSGVRKNNTNFKYA